MDKKGKLFGKVSIIDIILIIIIIAAVCAVGLKTMNAGSSAQVKSDTQFYVTFKVENVRSYTLDAVEEGDIFYEKNAAKLGTVTAVSGEPYMEIVTLQDGTSMQSPSVERYTVYITMLCEGKEDADGFYIGGTKQVASGMDIKLKSANLNCNAEVYDVERK
ncbi:MAG: DUF4330 domain-containing protein [Clostridia bacterium]|nr:DUF4330 domain-containing protein [Clostridia bacterium]MBQ1374727.1 DUF4330 domain-containing protein [Clostridia bacterium]MBQ1435056.1 DUF4330 domain-containing protein [Clostridia bacterium]MBQ4249016.1 DUF4330 domain-containing protein [Clostridia bacterium]